jgi:AcrR family transcriptional regulator
LGPCAVAHLEIEKLVALNRNPLETGKTALATRLKQQRLADRPQLILDAAVPIIGDRGYYGFSIKEVAERCGLSVPGVLHHFSSKEALLHAVIKDREERDSEAIWQDVVHDGLAGFAAMSLEDLKMRLHATVLRNSKQPEILRLFSMLRTEALYPQHPAYEYFHNRAAVAIEVLALALTRQVASPISVARQIMATMTGLENIWLEQSMEFDLVEEWDRMIEKLLA